MKKILIPTGCRSDEGLSAPIIRRLKEQDWCKVYDCKLEPQNFITSYQKMDYLCKAEKHLGNHNAQKPDLVFITGDRVEMCAAAAASFHNKTPIAHYYAGCINEPPTVFDDTDRHCITLWSDIQFVENDYAAGVVWDLKKSVKLHYNAHVVGISHLDDMVVDESLTPGTHMRQDYDLYLINYTGEKFNIPDFGNLQIHIGSNPDGNIKPLINATYYDNVPRGQFLGLLKYCNHFITNSSAAYYEAPYFLKPEQIIMVGLRNRNRHAVTMNTGASDKIVSILKEYLT